MATDPVKIDVKVKTLSSQTFDFNVKNDVSFVHFLPLPLLPISPGSRTLSDDRPRVQGTHRRDRHRSR